MTAAWEDVNARARGLATHLLARDTLQELARAPDPAALARALDRAGLLAATTGDQSPAALELAIRRTAAARLRLLARWLGRRTDLLRIAFEDEDRRSLRALARGAAAGAPSDSRLAGLIPTPSLPERLLQELARQRRPREVAALLVTWGHPYGSPMLTAAGADPPDLFRVETAINFTFATRAAVGARRGGAALRAYVEDTLDLENARSALVLAASEVETPAASAFLPGGRRLSRERFELAAAADVPHAARLVAAAFADDIAKLVIRHWAAPGRLENELLGLRIRKLRDRARRDPLGPAPVLAYLLQLRAEAVSLHLLVWAAALGLPPALRCRELEALVGRPV